jgi:quercetin dioxygenase-like cupin family protein
MVGKVRRVVTGHDALGGAVFEIDETVEEAALGAVIWSTDELPADNNGEAERAGSPAGIAAGGTIVRVMTIEPGHRSPMHRTQTLDYGVVLHGSIQLELDGGATKALGAGDIVVQRGTIHAWENVSDAPCRIAFILVAAEPFGRGWKAVGAHARLTGRAPALPPHELDEHISGILNSNFPEFLPRPSNR